MSSHMPTQPATERAAIKSVAACHVMRERVPRLSLGMHGTPRGLAGTYLAHGVHASFPAAGLAQRTIRRAIPGA